MTKISKIEFTQRCKSIKSGFVLGLGNTTVLTGVNNSGKTNFIVGVNEFQKYAKFIDANDNDITNTIELIYIPAEIVVTEDKFKIGKTSELIKELKDHGITGDPAYKLQPDTDDDNKREIQSLFDLVNGKLRDLLRDGSDVVEVGVKEEVSLKDVLEQVFEIKPSQSPAGIQHKSFHDLGQGWQRLIIISFILAASERKMSDEKLKLVLIEEPEIYLHPKLKKALNTMLKSIAGKDDYQVIMTTHDPYFAMSNQNEGSKIYSFEINDQGDTKSGTEGVISGIEDELLHIFLFNKVLMKATNDGVQIDGMKEGENLDSYLKSKSSTVKQYKWSNGDDMSLSLPLAIRHMIHHPDNPHTVSGVNNYSDQKLEESIKILNSILGE